MINSLQIGELVFANNLIQGPLAGISCAPFRVLTERFSQPAYTCTEMMSCKTLIHQPSLAKRRFLYKDAREKKVCFQLSGNAPQEVAEATRIATQAGADLIDLNCGCPVKKIRSRGAGSSLLTNSSLLFKLITAMKLNTHVPVGVKIRVQGHSKENFHDDLIHCLQEAGTDFVIVHGRHWSEHYETPCRHEQIAYFARELKLPVIGNGDIHSFASLKIMMATGVKGAMIARAGVGQPWLIKKLTAEANGNCYTEPNVSEKGDVFLEHIQGLAAMLENETFALLQARKFAKYYARNFTWQMAFTNAMQQATTLQQAKTLVTTYFKV